MVHACCAGCAMQSIHPRKSRGSARSATSCCRPDGLPSMPTTGVAAKVAAWRAASSSGVVTVIENGSRLSRSSASGAGRPRQQSASAAEEPVLMGYNLAAKSV